VIDKTIPFKAHDPNENEKTTREDEGDDHVEPSIEDVPSEARRCLISAPFSQRLVSLLKAN
ncbi:unnamed protein product, partial [Ilex paraguariensis]